MYIKVRVITDAPKEVVQKEADDHYVVYIREPAERGLANKRILEIIRSIYPHMPVRIVNGHHSPSKLVLVGNE